MKSFKKLIVPSALIVVRRLVDFTEQDITRVTTFSRMKLPAFEEMYLQVDEDGDKVFKSMPCPFLGPDNLCDIYDVRPTGLCSLSSHTRIVRNLSDQSSDYQKYAFLSSSPAFCGKTQG